MSFNTYHYLLSAALTVPLLVGSVYYIRKYPSKPIMSFIATTVMASVASYCYFSQTWDLSHESVMVAAEPGLSEFVMIFCMSYMIADFPVVVYLADLQMNERWMYAIHHLTAAVSLFTSIYYQSYGRLMVFFITAEISNIFLNLRKLVPRSAGIIGTVVDLIFVALFFGYRMCYLYPILVRTVFTLAFQQEWFDLLVINQGPFFIGILHLYWCYLIGTGIWETIFPPRVPAEIVQEVSQSNLSKEGKKEQ